MKEQLLRKSYEVALQSARACQSKETGYIQHNACIPVIENLHFCLALLRAKTHETMQEAKLLLEKILYFQQLNPDLANKGNFPVHLHEYPYCRDHYTAAKVVLSLYLIQRDFGSILGESLRQRLAASIQEAAAFAKTNLQSESCPLWLQMVTKAVDQDPICGSLASMKPQDFSQESIGYMLAASYIAAPTLSQNWLLEFVQNTFHNSSKTYIGPAFCYQKDGFTPKISLYDYMVGLIAEGFPERALQIGPQHIQAALSFMVEDQVSNDLPVEMKGSCSNMTWHVYNSVDYGLSWIESQPFPLKPDFYPFLFVVDERVMSLKAPSALISCKASEKTIELECRFTQDLFQGNDERKKVFSLTMPDTNTRFLIRGRTASTFSLDEPIEVVTQNRSMRVTVTKLSGDVSFFGNLGPVQKDNAVGREIALRRLSGSSASIGLKISL